MVAGNDALGDFWPRYESPGTGVPARSGGVKGHHHETLPLFPGRVGSCGTAGLGLRLPSLLVPPAATLHAVRSAGGILATARSGRPLRANLRSAASPSPGVPDPTRSHRRGPGRDAPDSPERHS